MTFEKHDCILRQDADKAFDALDKFRRHLDDLGAAHDERCVQASSAIFAAFRKKYTPATELLGFTVQENPKLADDEMHITYLKPKVRESIDQAIENIQASGEVQVQTQSEESAGVPYKPLHPALNVLAWCVATLAVIAVIVLGAVVVFLIVTLFGGMFGSAYGFAEACREFFSNIFSTLN